jgi:hypothetical protein
LLYEALASGARVFTEGRILHFILLILSPNPYNLPLI